MLEASLSLRQLKLLLTSAGFALLVAAAAAALGGLAASALWQWSRAGLRVLRWSFLLLLFVPPYLQAYAWTSALAATNFRLGGSGAVSPVQSWILAWWAETLIYAPLTVGLALLGHCALNPRLLEAARLLRPDHAVWGRVALPLAWPSLAAGAGLVFLLSLADYGVPSLLQVVSYPLTIFAYFSGGGPAGGALLLSLPLLLLAVGVVLAVGSALRAASLRPVTDQRALSVALRWPWWLQTLQQTALALLALQLAVPLLVFASWTESLAGVLRVAASAAPELQVTLGIAVAAGLACLPLGGALAGQLGQPQSRTFWWTVVLLPAALPAPLLAVGLVEVWNRTGLHEFESGLLLPVLISIARFAPLAALLIFAQLKRIDTALLEAGSVFSRNRLSCWWRVHLPLYRPGLLAAALLVASLSAGELGGTLIVAAPGRATLAMRIYNYLHYGASESVAGLCLLLTGVSLALGLAVLLLLNRGEATQASPAGRRA